MQQDADRLNRRPTFSVWRARNDLDAKPRISRRHGGWVCEGLRVFEPIGIHVPQVIGSSIQTYQDLIGYGHTPEVAYRFWKEAALWP